MVIRWPDVTVTRVLVFAKGDKLTEAEAAGADYVGAEELIPRIQKENWFEYDVVVATPDMMGVVGRLGKVLVLQETMVGIEGMLQ